MLLTACGKPSEEKVRSQMEKYLYEKYGEEFVVDRIGMRSANEQKFYQARIYPKSIIGTEKEGDDYYYASASIDVNSFGRLDKEAGDDYSFIRFNDDTEKFLLTKAKELFGERVRLKVDASLKIRDTEDIIKEVYARMGVKNYEPQNIFLEYKEHEFSKAHKRIRENPIDNRLELTLYLYLFDRIDSEEEKEERREQIFEFIQYLKVEGLFEYTNIQVNIVDERVLANSYRTFRQNERNVRKEKFPRNDIYIKEGYIKLPPLEFRKKMTEVLTRELEKMTEEELMKNMNRIKKEEMGLLEEFTGNSLQYLFNIPSEKYAKKNNVKFIEIKSKKDIDIGRGLAVYFYTYIEKNN
jgi:hypothetical protein